METFYLVDFENVNNEGIENATTLSEDDHIHIFSTENAINIRMDIAFSKTIDIQAHIVPVRKQSLDMHLVSYLGHLLGIHGKKCSCVIISKDTDYDNIIKFWKDNGYPNISRKPKIQKAAAQKKSNASQPAATVSAKTMNAKINAGISNKLSSSGRTELNVFVQHNLINMGYDVSTASKICNFVIARCNEDRMLNGIHKDIRNEFDKNEYAKAYEDVKFVLYKFVEQKGKDEKREAKIRTFFGQHFKEAIYVEKKEQIITILINAKSKHQINNDLMTLYSDGNTVKHIYQTVQPLLKELPGS